MAIYVPARPTCSTFNDPAHRHFCHPQTSPLTEGETTNDNNVRLKGGALRRNLKAFLGSALSVAPLLPWLPVKSFLCPFVAKFFCFVFLSKTSFVSGHAGACMMENVGTCCPDSHVLCQIPVPSFGGLIDIFLACYSRRTSHPLFILHVSTSSWI